MELTKLGGHLSHRLSLHKSFVLEPIADQVGDADQLQIKRFGVLYQLWQTRHGSIGVLDFTDHPCRVKPRQASQIHPRFGMSGSFQHPSPLGPQGKKCAPVAVDRWGGRWGEWQI